MNICDKIVVNSKGGFSIILNSTCKLDVFCSLISVKYGSYALTFKV